MDKLTLIIGRGAGTDITLHHDAVSREHARITTDDHGSLYIEDLGSTNGTFVNGKRISGRVRLRSGDTLLLGTYSFPWEEALLAEHVERPANTPAPSPRHLQKSNKPSATNRLGRVIVTAIAILAVGLSVGAYTVLTDNNKEDGEKADTTQGTGDSTDPATEGGNTSGSSTTQEQENSSAPARDVPVAWQEPVAGKRSYSISCLRDSSLIGGIIGMGNDFKTEWFTDDGITVADERKVGLEVKEQIGEEYRFSSNSRYKSRIQAIMNRLLPRVQDTTQYTYEWYILDSDEVNAFTAGGQIFITTGIIDFAESDDELACVIGHEIYHNELGHIRQKLEEQSFMENWLGTEAGQIALMASSVLTMSFNQENEAYCDLYGLDLAVDAGYNGCSIAGFWERMADGEDSDDMIGKVLRTHPYSSERKQCIHQHIASNYTRGCR